MKMLKEIFFCKTFANDKENVVYLLPYSGSKKNDFFNKK